MFPLLLLVLSAPPERIALRIEPSNAACALEPALEAALRRWLPGIELGGDSAPLTVAVRGDQRLQVVLQDADGAPALVRSLDRSAAGCTADADAIALIVERYLRDLGWVPSDPPLPGPEPPPPPPAEPPPTATPTATPTAEAAPPAPAPPVELGLLVRAGVELGLDVPEPAAVPGAELQVNLLIGSWARAWVAGSVAPVRAVDVERQGVLLGELVLRSFAISAGAAGCTPLAGGRFCPSLGGGVEVIAASASGDRLFQTVSTTSGTGRLQLELPFELALGPSWGLTAGVIAIFRFPPLIYQIDDAPPDYRVPPLTAAGRLGLWMRFF